MAADAVCLVNTPCLPLQIAVSVVFNAVADPGQVSESAVYLDGFAVDLNLPSGYENGGAKSTGRTLTLFGVNGVAADALGNVSLAVDSANARLEYAPNREAANALTVGGYTATIAMTQTELLGTVFMQVAIEVSPRPLSADEYGLSAAPDVVTVAAGDGAVGEEVAAVSLTAAAAGAEVVLPDVFPGGVSMSLLSDARGAAFYLTTALAGGAEIDETTALTVSLTGNANYAPLERAARIRVSALAQPVALETAGRIVDGAPFASADVANLKTGDYANATFARVDDESSGELLIGADSGVVYTNGDITATGRYSLVALATSPDYIGKARLEVILNVLAQNTLDPTNGIPESARVRTRLAVAGHAGSVAFFAAGREGVTLRTPTAAPSGFGFGADGLGAEFVSPAGLTLFLDAGEIADEGDAASAAFELTAKLAGFEDATIPITVTVTAVSRPTQPTLRAAFAEEFSHSPALPSGLETGSVLSLAGVSVAVGEGASLFAVANNRIERGAQAADVGRYEISLALSHLDLLGTLTLVVPAEIAAAELAAADYGLPGLTPEGITVAADYAGSVYAVALPESASVAIIELPSEVGAGFALSLSSDSRTATLLLDPALSGGAGLSDSFTLAVVRQKNGAADGNYAPLTQTLFATVSALSEVALAGVSGLIPYNGAYAENASIYDFRTELGGAYAEATFGKESGAAQLDVSAEGVVSSNADIAVPDIYTIVATATASAYLGTARMTFELELTAEAVRTVRPDDVVAAGARSATIDAAVGFSGPAYAVPVSVGYALQNPTFAPAGGGLFDADNTVIAIPVANPIGGAGLNLEMTADAVCLVNTPCLPLQIAVSVVFDAVADPGQDLESAVYLDGFAVDLNLPSGYENGGAKSTGRTLTLFGVNGVAADALGNVSLAVDSANARLEYAPNREAANALTVGGYTATVAMTQAELLGTVYLAAAFEITPRPLSADEYGLSAAPDVVTVAAGDGAVGEEVAAVSLTTSARAEVVLPDVFPGGVSMSLLSDARGAAFYLTTALAGGDSFEAEATLTVSRLEEGYDTLPQILTLALTALRVPPVVLESGEATSRQGYAGVVSDLALYENGAYAGANFEEAGDSEALEVDAAGVVSVSPEDGLPPGAYGITVLARGIPDSAQGRFVGAARITVSVDVSRGTEDIAADEVVAAEFRAVTIDAAVGYVGEGYRAPVRSGHTLSAEVWDAAAFDYDADREAIVITTPLGADAVAYVVTAEADCDDERICRAILLTITAHFNPVSDPGQGQAGAAYLDGFVYDLILPSGYENGGAKAAGRTLTLLGVDGVDAAALADVSLAVDSGNAQLAYAPDGNAASALNAGGYTATIGMTQAELLGTVFMRVAVEVSPRPLSADDYGLSAAPDVVTVAAGDGAAGAAVATIALTTSATDAQVVLPEAFPSGLSISRTADTFGAVFYLASGLASESVLDEVGTLTVSLTDNANYAPLERTARIRVSALAQFVALETSGRIADGAVFSSDNVANLKTGDYANAVFARVDDESDSALQIGADSGVVSTDGDITAAGRYSLVALATSPDYVGAARLEVILNVLAQNTLGPADSIPESGRVRTRLAVAGYAGSVAFFAAERSGVILETPASAPSGFGFGADGAGAEFVSPEGFTLFMDAGQIADEGDAATAAFTLTAKLTGFEDADVPVTVTVTAVSRPVQPVLRAAHADPFSHSPVLPVGLETGAVLSVAGVSVSGEGDGANLFAVANGRVEQGAQAPEVGSYEISLALTHSDLLGTLTLIVSAEISAAELREADYGLAGLTPGEPIAVAANYVGSVYAVALPESAADAIIQLPSDVASDEFELALSGDSRGAELRLTSAAAGAEVSGAFALTVVRQSGGAADANYLPLSQTLHATVSALPEVDLAATSGFVPYAANNNIYDLRAASGAAHASAAFVKGGGAAQLDVSAAGVVFSNAGIGAAGIYTLIATATSDAYLGSARMTFELTLSAPQAAVAFSAVPADGSGGTLTADGLTSGDFVERGSEVVFAARPAAEWHVASWSAGECGADSVGDPLAPGVEKTCALRANAALDVTVFFARAGEITEAEGVAAARRDATVYVAPSYQGEVHRAFAESAEIVVASDSVSHGRTDLFAASIGGGTLTIVLRAPLAADFAADVFTITLEGVGAGARVPRVELVSVRVERLALPIAGRAEFDGDDERTKSETIVYDFAAANPDYNGAAFELVSAPAELTMETDGKVLVSDKESLQEGGSYNVRAVARGAAANPFLGSAEFELEVNVRISEGAALSALPLARRTAEVFAVSGYQGSVYALTLESGSPFEAAYLPPPSGFDLDEATGEVSVPALLVSELGGLFTVRISRGGSAFRNAAVSLAVFAVAPRQQRDIVATLAADGTPSGFPHPIALPSGFAAADYQTSILGVDGGANHFALANNALTTGTEPLTIGAYAITLGIWHSGFLGTITAIINARVGGFGDIADADEIPEGAREAEVLVAPSYAGEVYRAAASADVELLLPDAVDSGFALARGADNEAVFSLLAPLSSEGEAVVTATITQRSGEVFEDATVAVSVSALAVPDELQVGIEERSAAIKVAAETGVITLSLGGLNAADLAFSLHADDGGYFETPPAGGSAGEVGVTLAPPIGSYGITVAAWSAESPPAFLGTVYHAAVLIVRADDAPALEVATAFPQNGTTLTSRAAVGYVGALLTLTSPIADVVLRFPQAGRAAFDSREDFAYDYDANVLSLKRALENGGRADATITLTAERAGGAAELTVSVFAEALAVDSVSAGINAVAGHIGGLYDFASGDLAEASFRQVSVSSEALTLLADGSVVATSALGEVGERYTLVGAAAAGPDPLLFFHGEAEVSLEVEVASYPQRRGVYYQEYNEGECSDLGGNWRLPGFVEAGALITGPISNSNSIGFDFLGDGDAIPGFLGGFILIDRNGAPIVEHGVWLETSLTGREDENSPSARVAVRRNGARVAVDVLPADDAIPVSRYCVAPVDPATYRQPLDPAGVCFADADETGCDDAAPIFYGVSQGDVLTVRVLAVRGVELARVSDAGFDLSVQGPAPENDFASYAASSSSSGVLTVALTMSRDLDAPALATLRVTPESGASQGLEVLFSPGGFVRRGLRFQQLADGGSCSALGTGWRLPNFAEASGLLWEGDEVTLRAAARVDIPGLSGSETELSLPAAGADDVSVSVFPDQRLSTRVSLNLQTGENVVLEVFYGAAIQTDLIGLDSLSGNDAVNVAAVRTTVGATIGITGRGGGFQSASVLRASG